MVRSTFALGLLAWIGCFSEASESPSSATSESADASSPQDSTGESASTSATAEMGPSSGVDGTDLWLESLDGLGESEGRVLVDGPGGGQDVAVALVAPTKGDIWVTGTLDYGGITGAQVETRRLDGDLEILWTASHGLDQISAAVPAARPRPRLRTPRALQVSPPDR